MYANRKDNRLAAVIFLSGVCIRKELSVLCGKTLNIRVFRENKKCTLFFLIFACEICYYIRPTETDGHNSFDRKPVDAKLQCRQLGGNAMNYEPMLKILSRITDEDGDKKTEMTVNAKISGTENDYMIEYDENIVPDCLSHTQIKVSDGKSVSVIRSGGMSHEITAEPGKRHICHYTMPFGELVFGVYGKRINTTVCEDGGRLEFEYEISYPDGFVTTNAMTVDIYPKGATANEQHG